MTTDQDNKRVSDTYRDLADESTPARLDDRILAMAAHESRSRYGIARAWIRPVAWAATIGLSLAFVLELTWFADIPGENGAPRPALSPEPARQDEGLMKAKQADEQHRAIAEQADTPYLTVPASLGPEPTSPPAEFDEMPPAAEDASRLRSEAAATVADATEQDYACDREARAAADTWYECILELREQGLDDAAAGELEALLRAFPDFREPRSE